MTEIVFADRRDAGWRLGEALRSEGHVAPGALVAGIPRGGVVVAAEAARVTGLPLRAVLARKVGAPHRPELAIGAVGPDGTAIFDEELVVRLGATREWLAQAAEKERAMLAERAARLPAVLQRAEAEGRRVIVIDDGVATGATAAAVGAWLGGVGAARRVLALPVGPPATVAQLAEIYDDVVTLAQPSYFFAVGQWYRDFTQTTDDEVIELLSSYSAGGSGGA